MSQFYCYYNYFLFLVNIFSIILIPFLLISFIIFCPIEFFRTYLLLLVLPY